MVCSQLEFKSSGKEASQRLLKGKELGIQRGSTANSCPQGTGGEGR